MNALWQVPVVVASLLTWLSTPPDTLADAAEREAIRRLLTGKATRVYTNMDLPLSAQSFVVSVSEPGAPSAPAASTPPAGETESGAAATSRAPEIRDEAWWRGRVAALRQSIERNQLLLDAMQTRVNALTTDIVNRDDPFQRQELREQLQKSLAELDRLQNRIVEARQGLETLEDEARRSGTPPGWLR
jgi:hypothetical protein